MSIPASEDTTKAPPTHAASSSLSLQSSENEDLSSVVSDDCEATKKQLAPRFCPPPLISPSIILVIGFALFGLAMFWPPLILVVAFVASRFIPYCFRTTDEASVRRTLFADFQKNNPHVPTEFRQTPSDIDMQERYWVNSRGMCLQTATVAPKNIPIQAVVCFCHGYTDQSSFMKRIEHFRLVRQGIAMVYIEIEGHGRSDGMLGLIPDWNVMANDVADYFKKIHATRFHDKPFYLMGESMGGAIAYTVYQQAPEIFRGVVFQAPMCKIKEDVLPPKFVIDFVNWLMSPTSWFRSLGYLPIAPAEDLCRFLGQNAESLALLDSSPTFYDGHPRLLTAETLLNVTEHISATLSEFDAPFLVQHGSADRITDPKLSQALYDEAKSKDKTIKIYKDMWHSLTHGESEQNKQKVFNDVAAWVLARC